MSEPPRFRSGEIAGQDYVGTDDTLVDAPERAQP